MKKIFVIFLIIIIFLIGNAYVLSKKNTNLEIDSNYEIRGIYISYIEYLEYFQNNSIEMNKVYINKMLDRIKELNFNTIFLHVSPFSDSIFNSSIFPSTYSIVLKEGESLGMDYLKYFIEESHKRNIYLHAWINPYRISSSNDITKLSSNNIALKYIESGDASITNNGIYYNPASSNVKDLLLKYIKEILINYNIDGIHLDDYFYESNDIDLKEYTEYKKINDVSLKEFRLNIINDTIKSIYKLIKNYNSNILFSISPDGNINNNYELHYADIKTWLQEDNYIDIIMPQIYFGFDNELKPFDKTIVEWNNLITNKVKLVPVLALYKSNLIDNYAGIGKYEWINNNNIIEREINYSKIMSNYQGYTLFRYSFLVDEKCQKEVNNLKNIKNR